MSASESSGGKVPCPSCGRRMKPTQRGHLPAHYADPADGKRKPWPGYCPGKPKPPVKTGRPLGTRARVYQLLRPHLDRLPRDVQLQLLAELYIDNRPLSTADIDRRTRAWDEPAAGT